jgi:hypothetical protein
MPGVRKSLFSAVAGTLVAAGLVVPGALNPASADPAANPPAPTFPTAPQAAPVKWSSQLGPVPRAATSTAPALMYEFFPVREPDPYELRLLLFWSDLKPGSGISYQSSVSLPKNQWSPPAEVDGGAAVTNSQPSATPLNSAVPGQLIVAWTNRTNSRVMYSIGQPRPHYRLEWSLADTIPGATASGGPVAYSPFYSDVVVVAWKSATGDAIDYSVGRLEDNDSRLVWQNFSVIPKASATSAPAIAEVSTSPDSGRIYVLWTSTGRTGPVEFATTADPFAGRPRWTAPAALPASVRSGAAPAAQAIGTQASYALLVVYRALRGSALYYVTIAKGGKVSKPLEVPHLRSANGLALTQGVLAAQSPDPDSIFYQTYVRACAGC